MVKNVLVFKKSARYSCQILMEFETNGQIFEKLSNIKFHQNPSSGSQVIPRGRTDRHDETNSRFWQFCERVRIAST